MSDPVPLMLVGLGAGLIAGLFGVGGGIMFVPALAFFAGLSHLEAEATSLLAIVWTESITTRSGPTWAI